MQYMLIVADKDVTRTSTWTEYLNDAEHHFGILNDTKLQNNKNLQQAKKKKPNQKWDDL